MALERDLRARFRRSLGGSLIGLLLIAPVSAAEKTGFADVNGVTLKYRISGSGRPLVLIHGLGVHSGYWDTDHQQLAKRYTVLRYDRRGCGDSSAKPDVTADPADLKALLLSLEFPEAYILGHSLGGTVALTFAARYPEMVRGLVLFGASPPEGLTLPASDQEAPLQQWMALGKTGGIESLKAAIQSWARKNFGGEWTSETQRRVESLLADYSGADFLDPATPSLQVKPATLDELPRIRVPTLILVGEDEMIPITAAADVFASDMPGAHKVVIPAAGHAANWQQPERFVAEIFRFLRRLDSPGQDEKDPQQ